MSVFQAARPRPGTAGTRWGANGDRLGTPTPQDRQREQQSLGDQLVRREQVSGRDGNLATGGRLGQTSGDPRRNGAVVKDASRTSEQTAPEPGHLMREARTDQAEGRSSARWRANEAGVLASAPEVREDMPTPMAEDELGRTLRRAAERQGGR